MDEENEKRILFFVPYHEREDAKRLGAKWDSKAKKWWVPADGTDLRPFGRWLPVPRDYLPEVPLGSPRIAPDINPVGSLRALMPLLSPAERTELKRKVFLAANYSCEACGQRGSEHPVECHDVWQFDSETTTQRLEGVHAFCPECHNVRHAFDRLAKPETKDSAMRDITGLLAMVNGWNLKDVGKQLKVWDDLRASLAGRVWKLDASALLSYGVPLSESTMEKLGLRVSQQSKGESDGD